MLYYDYSGHYNENSISLKKIRVMIVVVQVRVIVCTNKLIDCLSRHDDNSG